MLLPYQPLTAPFPQEEWQQDFRQARRIKGVRFGAECLYLSRFAGLGGRYIPYRDIVRWYIQLKEATGGEATFHSYRLVVNYGAEGEWAASLGEYSANLNERTPEAEVRTLMAQHPEIPLGRDPQRRTRFR
ncbi:MAG: hypothetical protein LIO78_04960 [Clostridiales bacterium]|nr:hypothetical protein [Clostridiales bacterium]